jgi:hypothetical protein
MRSGLIYVLIGLALVGAVAVATYLGPLLEVRISGEVKVPQSLKVADVVLVINQKEGSETFDLGEVFVPKGPVRVRVSLESYEGNFSLAVGGALTLESGSRSYRVQMPCAIAIGEPCYRVMVLIPGYDAPMLVEEGSYRVRLNLSWRAEGSGKFTARLHLLSEEGLGIRVLGLKPENTDGWVVAENSTRSYAMLLSTSSTREGKVRVYVWVFDPQNIESGEGRIRVVEQATGTAREACVRMFRDGVTWSTLLEVDVEPGKSYVVEYSFDSITLKAKVGP